MGPERRIVSETGVINHVVTAIGHRIPEFCETLLIHVRHSLKGFPRFPGDWRKLDHGVESVVPKGVDFYGLGDSRRYDPIANLCIHPGELHSVLARVEETVGFIHMNVISSALDVSINYLGRGWIKFRQGCRIVRGIKILPDGFEGPKCGIHGVVFRPSGENC
jgi:hypothetical protein